MLLPSIVRVKPFESQILAASLLVTFVFLAERFAEC